ILGSCIASIGCMVAPEETDLAIEAPPLETQAIELANGANPAPCFWGHGTQFDLRQMAMAPIANMSGMMASFPHVPSNCYKVIQDMVECALRPTDSVTNPYTLAVYHGIAALGAGWRYGALTGDSRKWVTACMVQRLNAVGTPIPILETGNDQ